MNKKAMMLGTDAHAPSMFSLKIYNYSDSQCDIKLVVETPNGDTEEMFQVRWVTTITKETSKIQLNWWVAKPNRRRTKTFRLLLRIRRPQRTSRSDKRSGLLAGGRMLNKEMLLAFESSPYPGFKKCLLIAGRYKAGRNDERFGFYDGECGTLEPKLASKICVRRNDDGVANALLSDKQFYFEDQLYPATGVFSAGDWTALGQAIVDSWLSQTPMVVYIKA